MKIRDLKYLTAFIVPFLAYYGMKHGQLWSWSALIFAFGIVPILEMILPVDTSNVDEQERERRLTAVIFDVLLLLNIPIIYGLIIVLGKVQPHTFGHAYYGNIISTGVALGACGINVAHELGHRNNKFYHLTAKILLLPCLYQHFFIEHNRGHHKHVATAEETTTISPIKNIKS